MCGDIRFGGCWGWGERRAGVGVGWGIVDGVRWEVAAARGGGLVALLMRDTGAAVLEPEDGTLRRHVDLIGELLQLGRGWGRVALEAGDEVPQLIGGGAVAALLGLGRRGVRGRGVGAGRAGRWGRRVVGGGVVRVGVRVHSGMVVVDMVGRRGMVMVDVVVRRVVVVVMMVRCVVVMVVRRVRRMRRVWRVWQRAVLAVWVRVRRGDVRWRRWRRREGGLGLGASNGCCSRVRVRRGRHCGGGRGQRAQREGRGRGGRGRRARVLSGEGVQRVGRHGWRAVGGRR